MTDRQTQREKQYVSRPLQGGGDIKMLKAGDLACREDSRVRGIKSGKTRRDRGISHGGGELWLKMTGA